jgi:NADPH:quinone reductase-like Zn-dependent oxidoreductase
MKAMAQDRWGAVAPLALVDLETPAPQAGEVVVAVRAIGVNPVDWKMRQGGLLGVAARFVGPKPPVVPGVDFAGVVEAVGSRVTSVKPGDSVVGAVNFARKQRGSYADTVVVREDQICRLPEGFDLEVAGAVPVAGVTAWMCVVDIGRITSGKKALIIGASGGVGQFAVQIAKHVKGAFVVGVCSGRNADLVRSLGADAIVDYTAGDALADAKAHGPFDLVLDCVGGYAGNQCRALLAPGGRHVMVNGDASGAVGQALIAPFRSRIMLGQPDGARLKPVIEAIAAGKIHVNIAQRLPLTEAEEATRLSQSGRSTGKIILVP